MEYNQTNPIDKTKKTVRLWARKQTSRVNDLYDAFPLYTSGDRIKYFLKEHDMKQSTLAELIPCSVSHLRKICNGLENKRLTYSMACRIADLLETEIYDEETYIYYKIRINPHFLLCEKGAPPYIYDLSDENESFISQNLISLVNAIAGKVWYDERIKNGNEDKDKKNGNEDKDIINEQFLDGKHPAFSERDTLFLCRMIYNYAYSLIHSRAFNCESDPFWIDISNLYIGQKKS